MDFYTRLARKPKTFLTVTGMQLHTFQKLMPQFEAAYLRLEAQHKQKTVRTGSTRLRPAGGGRPFNNDLANRLLMPLLYYRFYLTQDFLTLMFKAADKSLICLSIQQTRLVLDNGCLCLNAPVSKCFP
jgi:hypothetical protein